MAYGDYPVDSFDTGTQGQIVPGGNIWWGSSTMTWDGTQDSTGNGGGSGYITCTFSTASDTPCMADITLGLGGNNPWWCPISVDLTAYIELDFNLKWDMTASNMTIDEFNNPSTFDAGITDSYNGMEFGVFDAAPNRIPLSVQFLTNAAMYGWAHMSVPINRSTPGINDTHGIYFHKWFAGSPAVTGIAAFWIDDILFKTGCLCVPPPPTLVLHPAPQGLNLFAATTGQYDRQMIEVQPGTGVFSWLGNSGVTYSFTLSTFEAPAPGQQAHLFLIPNADTTTAPDWNDSNVIFVTLVNQAETNGDPYYIFQFAYKTNQLVGNSMFFSSNLLYGKCLTNGTAVGTWSVTFLNDTTVRLSGPGGVSTNFTAFDQASADLFADPLSVYFGMQPNNPGNTGIGHVVFTSVGVTGPNVTPVFDDFSAGGSPERSQWRLCRPEHQPLGHPAGSPFRRAECSSACLVSHLEPPGHRIQIVDQLGFFQPRRLGHHQPAAQVADRREQLRPAHDERQLRHLPGAGDGAGQHGHEHLLHQLLVPLPARRPRPWQPFHQPAEIGLARSSRRPRRNLQEQGF
ncbi:MAG: hypothetical protein U1F98_16975 [Verrucomicrobiota bacterium]